MLQVVLGIAHFWLGVLLRGDWFYVIKHFQEKVNLIFFSSQCQINLVIFFLLPLFSSGILQSCVKLDSLEPCEDLDSPANEESEEEKEGIVTLVIEEPKEKWDCESILSKYFGVLLFVPRISK